MPLPYLQLVYSNDDYPSFVRFWRKMYVPNTKTLPLYEDNIDKASMTPTAIQELYKWKNGGRDYTNNPTKRAFVEHVQGKIPLVNQLKRGFDRPTFDAEFGHRSAIWQIFLLHIIDPDEFPIFDQHVYRTHLFFTHRAILPIPIYSKTKMDYYDKVYRPFFIRVRKRYQLDRFELDNALWTFGRFLLTKEGKASVSAVDGTT